MIRRVRTALLPLLSAGVLAFCTAQPASAQPARTASGKYIDCQQIAIDVGMMTRTIKQGLVTQAMIDNAKAEWYTLVVVLHAREALATDNPAQYVRDMHKACLLETT